MVTLDNYNLVSNLSFCGKVVRRFFCGLQLKKALEDTDYQDPFHDDSGPDMKLNPH